MKRKWDDENRDFWDIMDSLEEEKENYRREMLTDYLDNAEIDPPEDEKERPDSMNLFDPKRCNTTLFQNVINKVGNDIERRMKL